MRGDSYNAWRAIGLITTGSSSHHKKPTEFALHDPETGTTATSPKQNIDVLQKFCTKLYNRDDAPVDWTILDEIPQLATVPDLEHPPTTEEVAKGIQKLKNNKAPGESGIPHEALKALSGLSITHVTELLQKYWTDPTVVHPEWQQASLTWLHKKGDRKDPSNYRGIVLQDILARLLSVVITARLQTILAFHGIEEQFGCQPGRGTIDALFALRSALQLRREHQTDTYALFIDLIKAFDTANHDLLFEILGKYGAPPGLIAVIRRLHDNFKLKLKIEKEECIIPYTVGVRQGDNMAPTLFIFLMQAFYTSFLHRWNETLSNSLPIFRYHSNNNGKLLRQGNPAKTKGTTFSFLGALFVDDCALLFDTIEEAASASQELLTQLRRFGLLMHVGTTEKKSKTEAMYFPANRPGVEITIPPAPLHPITIPADILLPGGNHVHFTDKFCYLGSFITNDLSDKQEITTRLRCASNQIGALMNFFRSQVPMKTKIQIFMAIPVNTAIYGCESWTLTAAMEKKITAFFHTGLRRIMRINMHQVEEHRIRNEHVRNCAGVPNLLHIIQQRQFVALGGFARLPTHRLPRKFINAWIAKPRRVGRPFHTLRNSLNESLGAILGPSVSDRGGAIRDWIPQATEKTAWDRLARDWLKASQTETLRLHGLHPLLGGASETQQADGE
jgi:hypothetical protein